MTDGVARIECHWQRSRGTSLPETVQEDIKAVEAHLLRRERGFGMLDNGRCECRMRGRCHVDSCKFSRATGRVECCFVGMLPYIYAIYASFTTEAEVYLVSDRCRSGAAVVAQVGIGPRGLGEE